MKKGTCTFIRLTFDRKITEVKYRLKKKKNKEQTFKEDRLIHTF